MKILLIWPRKSSLLFDNSNMVKIFSMFLSRMSFRRKPIVYSILSALTPNHHTIDIAEGEINDINFNKVYDLVGITSVTSNAILSYEIADKFRKHKIPVVIGGLHPSVYPEEAKKHADSVVIGDAEEIWPKLLKDLENNKLKPFYYQNRVVNPKLIPPSKNVYKKGTGIGIQATRGCPQKCEFCSIPNTKFGNIYTKRPIENVIEDINKCERKIFIFQDNSLTVDTNYTKKLFSKLIGINKKFLAYGNIDILGKDEELLKLANEAGCVGWLIGFESVSQASIDSIGKKTNIVKNYLSAVKKIHDFGMIIEASFVFGFDHDKKDIFNKTDEFIRLSEIGIPFGLILTPYPGTILYNRLEREKRILTKDWDKYDGLNAVFKPKHMSSETLLNNTEALNLKWHKGLNSIERIIKNMSFGFYPFTETLVIEIYWKLIYQRIGKLSNLYSKIL
ncbi:MAG: hypothetical protein AYK22_00050 [Thermoplasmatales archaeon SG8-52-3]|nr:MAG: hypothetical protein AYK22_00050 [Thermoplasmatales archaeon SG8-52-3]